MVSLEWLIEWLKVILLLSLKSPPTPHALASSTPLKADVSRIINPFPKPSRQDYRWIVLGPPAEGNVPVDPPAGGNEEGGNEGGGNETGGITITTEIVVEYEPVSPPRQDPPRQDHTRPYTTSLWTTLFLKGVLLLIFLCLFTLGYVFFVDVTSIVKTFIFHMSSTITTGYVSIA